MRRAKADNALGQNLRRIRRAKGWSQREAAAAIGDMVSCPYLCQIEKGHVKSPSLTVCMAIAAAYEITLGQMAEWIDSPFEQRPVCPSCGQEIEEEPS